MRANNHNISIIPKFIFTLFTNSRFLLLFLLLIFACSCNNNTSSTTENEQTIQQVVTTPVVAVPHVTPATTPVVSSPVIANPTMDSAGRYIPAGIPMTYTDTAYTKGMVLIKAARDTFMMGIDHDGADSSASCFPHPVCLTYDFYIDKYEVTCAKFCKVINYAFEEEYVKVTTRFMYDREYVTMLVNSIGEEQPLLNLSDKNKLIGRSSSGGLEPLFNGSYPVVFVSWYGAAFYCNMLSEMLGLVPVYNTANWSIDYTANGYRLPTTAEHEYATRAGTTTEYFWGDDLGSGQKYIADIGSAGGMYPVGSRLPNPFGLYDVVGSVQELCNDLYAKFYFSHSPFFNPTGPTKEMIINMGKPFLNERVIRGAESGWHNPKYADNITSYIIGFRAALPVKAEKLSVGVLRD